MKEWIGYYEDILTDELSDGIMSLTRWLETSTYANHKGNIGVEKVKKEL